MKILICGSRIFNDYKELSAKLDEIVKDKTDITIIQGGAVGADSLAERYASERKIPCICVRAKWEIYGRSAGYRRNIEMLNMLDKNDLVIAFMINSSKGTAHTINNAKQLGIKTIVFDYKE